MRRVPQKVFDVLWSTYFKEQLPKLAVHPVANFVVAQALKRVSVEQMDDVFEKLDGALGKIISKYAGFLFHVIALTGKSCRGLANRCLECDG